MSGDACLLGNLVCVCALSIHRAALWILGEYCTSVEDIARVLSEIRAAIGEVSHWLMVS